MSLLAVQDGRVGLRSAPSCRRELGSTRARRGDVATRAVREVLTPSQRAKLDPGPDSEFYRLPRFCNHCDDNFIRTQKAVYEQYLGALKPGEPLTVLDMASSHVSHMPESLMFDERYTFVGHGMNAEELARNPIFDRWFVRDFNADPPSPSSPLPFQDESLDAVVCCCSIQYFQMPEQVFSELCGRCLKPGGILIVSYTNRAFWGKAVSAWRNTTEYGRVQLVRQYCQAAGFSNVEEAKLTRPPAPQNLLERFKSILQGSPNDPFYCVVATK
mmetsp:Transcript_10451/g.28576  ORF Transcript_10451/g.28576 Transcript_10451/m.28576 type:complete len:272 (-) Transcript_10451:850-1665(-)